MKTRPTARTAIAALLTIAAAQASAGIADGAYDLRFPINASTSSADVTFGIVVFDPAGTIAGPFTIGLAGFVDIRVQVLAGVIASVDTLSAVVNPLTVSTSVMIPSFTGTSSADLALRQVSVRNAEDALLTTADSAAGGIDFALTGGIAYSGLLDATVGTLQINGVVVAGTAQAIPFLAGNIRLDGESFSLTADVAFHDGAAGQPFAPTGTTNLSFFGQGSIAATSVIPAPAAAMLLSLAGGAAIRRRR